MDQVVITGPFSAKGAGDTPSRRRLFVCKEQTDSCAGTILSTLMRRAYRHSLAAGEVDGPMAYFRRVRADGVEARVTAAAAAALTTPKFLFRVETDPATVPAGGVIGLVTWSWLRGCRSSFGVVCRMMRCGTSRRRASRRPWGSWGRRL